MFEYSAIGAGSFELVENTCVGNHNILCVKITRLIRSVRTLISARSRICPWGKVTSRCGLILNTPSLFGNYKNEAQRKILKQP